MFRLHRTATTTDPKATALRAVPAFRGLDDATLSSFARHVEDVELPAGARLTEQGRVGNEAFIVIDGHAHVAVAGEIVNEVGPGDIVGELSMLDHRVRSATVIAATPMRVLVAGRSQFGVFLANPVVMTGLARTIADRLRTSDLRASARTN
jgi:CRP/FNR family transcriptional regulator, cyclic AMP receptor protein